MYTVVSQTTSCIHYVLYINTPASSFLTSQYVDLEVLHWAPSHPLWVYPILHYITACDKISRELPSSYFIITLHHHMWEDLPGTSPFVVHYYITSPHVTRSPGDFPFIFHYYITSPYVTRSPRDFPLRISLLHYITACDKISWGLPLRISLLHYITTCDKISRGLPSSYTYPGSDAAVKAWEQG